MVLTINNKQDLLDAIDKINALQTQFEEQEKKEAAIRKDFLDEVRAKAWAKLHAMFHQCLPCVSFDRKVLENIIEAAIINKTEDVALQLIEQYAFCKELNRMLGME